MYADESLKKYLDDLAAKTPAPGGGSAAALAAALGASLISMVAHYTLGKAEYAQFEEENRKIADRSQALRKEFLRLVDLDVVAYKGKDMRDALNVPFMVARLCYDAVKLCPGMVGRSNRLLASDVAVAAMLLEAAFASAAASVEVNLKSLNDPGLTRTVSEELGAKSSEVKAARAETEEKVGALIRG